MKKLLHGVFVLFAVSTLFANAQTSSTQGTLIYTIGGSAQQYVYGATQAEALSQCQTTTSVNPYSSVSCTWNGQAIYSAPASATAPDVRNYFPSINKGYTKHCPSKDMYWFDSLSTSERGALSKKGMTYVDAFYSDKGYCVQSVPFTCVNGVVINRSPFAREALGISSGGGWGLNWDVKDALITKALGYAECPMPTTDLTNAVVVSIERGDSFDGQEESKANITIPSQASGKALVLISQVSTEWTIANPNNVQVKKIILVRQEDTETIYSTTNTHKVRLADSRVTGDIAGIAVEKISIYFGSWPRVFEFSSTTPNAGVWENLSDKGQYYKTYVAGLAKYAISVAPADYFYASKGCELPTSISPNRLSCTKKPAYNEAPVVTITAPSSAQVGQVVSFSFSARNAHTCYIAYSNITNLSVKSNNTNDVPIFYSSNVSSPFTVKKTISPSPDSLVVVSGSRPTIGTITINPTIEASFEATVSSGAPTVSALCSSGYDTTNIKRDSKTAYLATGAISTSTELGASGVSDATGRYGFRTGYRDTTTGAGVIATYNASSTIASQKEAYTLCKIDGGRHRIFACYWNGLAFFVSTSTLSATFLADTPGIPKKFEEVNDGVSVFSKTMSIYHRNALLLCQMDKKIYPNLRCYLDGKDVESFEFSKDLPGMLSIYEGRYRTVYKSFVRYGSEAFSGTAFNACERLKISTFGGYMKDEHGAYHVQTAPAGAASSTMACYWNDVKFFSKPTDYDPNPNSTQARPSYSTSTRVTSVRIIPPLYASSTGVGQKDVVEQNTISSSNQLSQTGSSISSPSVSSGSTQNTYRFRYNGALLQIYRNVTLSRATDLCTIRINAIKKRKETGKTTFTDVSKARCTWGAEQIYPSTASVTTDSTGATVLGASVTRCTILDQNLTQGSQDSSVVILQDYLAENGYLDSEPTGFYGSKTSEAVKKLQKQYDLPETGRTYTKTRALIQNITCTQ
ncbi:MAG: putative peptidoglycan binding domain [Candidatus Parcubacteria bacterium]|jgi:hypothetical protein